MLKVLFFAQMRELLDCDSMDVDARFDTVEALRSFLCEQGGKWPLALDRDKLLVAVNQEICTLDTKIQSGDEVAFFPPVTGG